VLLRTLWIDPDTLDVAVDGGVVTLTGTADRLSTVRIIGRMCRGVAGVVDVVNEIVPERDDTAELNHHNLMEATVKVMAP
jgi:BON domain-containing protein